MAEGADRPVPSGVPFGRYVLKERIARGGMGEVFRALAVGAGGFEKPVVVKRILPQLEGSRVLSDMFVDEARLMSQLMHPNIVQVIDFGQGADDDYFLVMELVDGVDLGRFSESYHRKDAAMPPSVVLYIISQILRGLAYAHGWARNDGEKFVHRDISPGNVLLSKVGEVKLADFGVALVSASGATDPTGKLVGKPNFMAPEQYRGQAVDARADLFSVGVVMFLLLTGEMPFVGDGDAERQKHAADGERRRASDLRSELGDGLEALIDRSLEPDAENRFATAREMLQAIAALPKDQYSVASSDDLAELVESAAADLAPKAKAVMLLNDARSGTVRELTRTGAHDGFTMRLAHSTESEEGSVIRTRVDSFVDAEKSASEFGDEALAAAPLPRSNNWKMPMWGLLAAAVIGGGYFFAVSAPNDGKARPLDSSVVGATESVPTKAPIAKSASTSEQPPAAPRPSLAVSVPAPVRGTAQASAGVNLLPPVQQTARPIASNAPPVAVSTTASAAPACVGEVLLSSKGSWWVAGGPGRVQAPGLYRWPCGSYTLVGSSRADGRQSRAAVLVHERRRATARFE